MRCRRLRLRPHEYLSKFYAQEPQDINRIIETIDDKGSASSEEDADDLGNLKDLASEAPIIKVVNLLITQAVENRASDIHIEPFEDELNVRYRIDGVLHDIESAPKRLQAAYIWMNHNQTYERIFLILLSYC